MLGAHGEYTSLSERMRAIRVELYGENGAFILAKLLGISEGKLTRMEAHGPIPGHVILAFMLITGANPGWLLSGNGERYSRLKAGCRVGRPGPEDRRATSLR